MINGLAILDLVHDDLDRVEHKMREMGEEAFGPLSDAFMHLIGSGGKRLRPALALAAYHIYASEPADKVIALGAAVETLHTATLVHDDLVDGSLLRRGKTTLNAVWSKGATVLAGDYLFARAAGFAAETGNIPVVQLFADTLRIICDGELRQMFSSRQWNLPKEDYYRRIFAKTASLFASAARSGAILGSAPVEGEQALYDYAYHLGMAFQIIDDILDFTGDEAVLGKPVGGDLRQGTVTLPFYYYLHGHPEPAAIVAMLQGGHPAREIMPTGVSSGHPTPVKISFEDAVAEIIGQIRNSDAIQQARNEALEYVERAKTSLAPLPAGIYRQSLSDLADFVVARDM